MLWPIASRSLRRAIGSAGPRCLVSSPFPALADTAAVDARDQVSAAVAGRRVYASLPAPRLADAHDHDDEAQHLHEQQALLKRWLEMESAQSRATTPAAAPASLPEPAPPAAPEEDDSAPGWKELLAAAEAAKTPNAHRGEQLLTDTYGCAHRLNSPHPGSSNEPDIILISVSSMCLGSCRLDGAQVSHHVMWGPQPQQRTCSPSNDDRRAV